MAGDEYVGGLFDNHARGMKGHPASTSSSSAAGHKTGGGLFGNHGRGGLKGGHKAAAAAAGGTEGVLSPGHKLLHKPPHTHQHHPHHTHTELHGIPKEGHAEAVAEVAAMLYSGPKEQTAEAAAAVMLQAGPREQRAVSEAAAMPLQRQMDALQCQEVKAESAGCMTEGSSETQQADRPAAAPASAETAR